MKRTTLIIGLCAAACAAVLLVVSSMQAQETPAAPAAPAGPVEGVAVLDTYHLMELLFKPSQEKLKELMAAEPAERRTWNEIKDHVGVLAEVSNLVTLRGELDYEKTPEWDQLSIAARDAALALLEPVKASDFAASKEKYVAMINACNTCHTRFEPEVAPKLEP